jgi:hypothetical protein
MANESSEKGTTKRVRGRPQSRGASTRKSGAERTREWRLRKSQEGLVEFKCFVPRGAEDEIRRIVENHLALNFGQAHRRPAAEAKVLGARSQSDAETMGIKPSQCRNAATALEPQHEENIEHTSVTAGDPKTPKRAEEDFAFLFGSRRA